MRNLTIIFYFLKRKINANNLEANINNVVSKYTYCTCTIRVHA